MPSTSVRCPRTQSGWHPPFGVGNVVAASLISSITLNTDPMGVIRDVGDVLVGPRESSDGTGPQFAPVWAQRDDGQPAVHFCPRQPPRHGLAFIVPEVRRFVERSDKAICDAESSILAD